MEHYMGLILAVVDILILILLLVSLSLVEDSRSKYEQLKNGADAASDKVWQEAKSEIDKLQQETKSEIDKLQQGITSETDKLMRGFAAVYQSIKPLSELTKRHERILSGSQSKGDLGERLVAEKLADLPHAWYDRNVTFTNGAKVEFALRAPNQRWVPIDSKWTATELLNLLGQTTDLAQRNVLKTLVQRAMRTRAKESEKYIDPDSTLGFCIVAVPDPVYELCVDIQAELTSSDIVLISYSLLVPYLLLIMHMFLKNNQAQSAQTLEVSHILSRAASQIELIQKYINRQVVPPLDVAKQQQTNYGVQIQGLEDLYARLNRIQNDLNVLKGTINPMHNADIGSIPKTLQRYLTKVQEGLLEGVEKQNGHNSASTSQ